MTVQRKANNRERNMQSVTKIGVERVGWTTIGILLLTVGAMAQQASRSAASTTTSLPAACGNEVRSTYLLGPDDELAISAPELEVTPGKTVRVDGDGDVQVPLTGRVHVAGLTVQQSEKEINKRLTQYIRDPQVSVDVRELRSQPASVLGAVNTPGIHQVQGRKTLLEMI